LKINHATLPTKYLGIILTDKAPKKIHFREMVDKIKQKLSGWKKCSLSMGGRLILIKHIISAIPLYTAHVYNIPKSIIKEIETLMKNFLWDGTHNIAWHKVTLPYDEGGLGIKKLEEINTACTMLRGWKCITSNSLWATYMKGKYIKQSSLWCTTRHKVSGSSAWKSIKKVQGKLENLTGWRIADGTKINIKQENWFPMSTTICKDLPSSNMNLVSDLIRGGTWNIPAEWPSNIKAMIEDIKIFTGQDRRVWNNSPTKEGKILGIYLTLISFAL